MRNHGFTYRELVDGKSAGRPVIAWLSQRWTHSSEAIWRERIAAGEVSVDGRIARPDDRLVPGAELCWRRPPWDEPDVPRDWSTLHEDPDLLAVAKPRGLPTMPAGGFLENTLWHLVRQRYPEVAPVHRLGRDTSGIVLFARSGPARIGLSRDFREHRVHKVYRTLAAGDPAWDELEIRTPIGPVPHPLLGTIHAASAIGRSAHSQATVVERRPGAALLDVRITTGRPHQIRIHLASVGHPLVGDPLYLPGGHARAEARPGDGGYWLHASLLRIVHPSSGLPLEVTCEPPASLR